MIDFQTTKIIEHTGMDMPFGKAVAAQIVLTELQYVEAGPTGQIDHKVAVIQDLIDRLYHKVYHEHNHLIRLMMDALTQASPHLPKQFDDRLDAFREDYRKLSRPQFNIANLSKR